jgi:hypothetical protein
LTKGIPTQGQVDEFVAAMESYTSCIVLSYTFTEEIAQVVYRARRFGKHRKTRKKAITM